MADYKENPKKGKPGKNPDTDPNLDIEAERVVLGMLMRFNDLIDEFDQKIEPEDFGLKLHQNAFEAMLVLRKAGRRVDRITLRAEIDRRSDIPDGSLTQNLSEIARYGVREPEEADQYVSKVLLWRKRRQAEKIAQICLDHAKSGQHDLLDQIAREVATASLKGNVGEVFQPMKEQLKASIARAFEQDANGWKPTGIPTGFEELDNAMGGFKPSKLYIVAAMEKAGKSSLGFAFAHHFLRLGKNVSIVSLEMKADEVADRMVMLESEVRIGHRPRGMVMTEEEKNLLNEVASYVPDWNLRCSEIGSLRPSTIRSACRYEVRHHKPAADVIIVDYLQIIGSEDGKGEQRKRVEEASAALREMAKELNVPVIALAQLNRDALKRNSAKTWKDFDVDSCRPRQGDLRETAQIEMDAHAIIALYRPEMILDKMRPFKDDDIEFEAMLEDLKSKAELSLLVNRSGPGARAHVHFRGDIMKFSPRKKPAPSGHLNTGYGDHMTSKNMKAR